MHYTYILRCQDDTLYTGYTTNVARRMSEHQRGINSKYTRNRGFKNLEIYFALKTRSEATKLEYRIKSKTRKEKLKLIDEPEKFIEEIKRDYGLDILGFFK